VLLRDLLHFLRKKPNETALGVLIVQFLLLNNSVDGMLKDMREYL
jgi:hypothetical protein